MVEQAGYVVGRVVVEGGEDLQGGVCVVAPTASLTVKMHQLGSVVGGVFNIIGVAGGVLLFVGHGVDHF